MNKVISIYVSDKMYNEIETLRGDIPRSRYISRNLERLLSRLKKENPK